MPELIMLIGLAGLLFGVWASIAAFLPSRQPAGLPDWPARRTRAFGFGLLLGLVVFAGQCGLWFGYPLIQNGESWWVVGIPFPAAMFDHHGHDYIGLLTLPFFIVNAFFWFLVPQMVLFYRGCARIKSAPLA